MMNVMPANIVFLSRFSVYTYMNEEQRMIRASSEFPGRQYLPAQPRSRLLQQHTVLTPVFLLGGSVGLFIASFSADRLFPALAVIGVPTANLCLLISLVLGISGILASIIYLIEKVDCYLSKRLQAGVFVQSKEHSYANRN